MTDTRQHKWRGKRKIFFFLLIIPAMLFLFGLIVMLLWNAVLTYLVNVPEITYWQAVGLLVLCRILTGSLRFGMRRGKSHFKEKWMGMSAEERTKFKEEWQKRCGIKKD